MKKRLDRYTAENDPILAFYEGIGILNTFRGDTTNELWPHVRDTITKYLS